MEACSSWKPPLSTCREKTPKKDPSQKDTDFREGMEWGAEEGEGREREREREPELDSIVYSPRPRKAQELRDCGFLS